MEAVETKQDLIVSRSGEARPSFERFILLLKAQRNVKPRSILTYLRVLDRFLRWTRKQGKGFKDWTAELATEYIASFEKPSTRFNYGIVINNFFELMQRPDASQFKVPPSPKAKLPDILSEEEVLRLAEACDRTRDRALIMVTFESTRRNHEIRGLRIRDIKFDDYGALVTFHSTKSEDATIRLIDSAPVLQQLLEHHRDRENLDAYVFYAQNSQITEVRFRQILKEAAVKAGLKRHVWPHLLRHSGIAKLKMNSEIFSDDDIMNISGHRDRRQLDRYGKITMRRTNQRVLEAAGLKQVEAEKKRKAKRCPRCKYVNEPLARFCSRCTLPLEEGAVFERDKLMMDIEALARLRGGREFFQDIVDDIKAKAEAWKKRHK